MLVRNDEKFVVCLKTEPLDNAIGPALEVARVPTDHGLRMIHVNLEFQFAILATTRLQTLAKA